MEKPKQLDNPDLKQLRKMCQEYADFVESKNYNCDRADDYEHYVLEEAMTAFFGPAFWSWFNERVEEHYKEDN